MEREACRIVLVLHPRKHDAGEFENEDDDEDECQMHLPAFRIAFRSIWNSRNQEQGRKGRKVKGMKARADCIPAGARALAFTTQDHSVHAAVASATYC